VQLTRDLRNVSEPGNIESTNAFSPRCAIICIFHAKPISDST